MNPPSNLERDISRFTDPATELKIAEGQSGALLQFIRNGVEHEYFLNYADGVVAARHVKNRRFASLKSLLASNEFADIRGFATTQARMYREFEVESLIPPEGELDGRRLALQTLHRTLIPHAQQNADSKIGIVLLDGPAGVGKTSLIERMVVQRARGQGESGSAPPILHVANRGRRLTALDDALAQSLQILRAEFTFDQVPALIRHNLIQLAIDGFDELVDPEGYKDAWYALRDFFESVDFGGPVILAGRDTFFDEQSFSRQMQESKQEFELNHVRLGAISPSAAKTWLAKKGWIAKDIQDPYTDLVLRPGSYALRPYFLKELAQAKSWKAIDSNDLTPRAYLVDRFVMRESTLLGEKLSLSSEEVKARLIGVFEEIAMEMADTETDAVDLSFLQMVTEFAFAGSLNPADIAKLRHKAGSFALLETDSREGFRRFPHTEISHHFLAQALIRQLTSGAPIRFIRRGLVTSDLLTILGEILLSQKADDAKKLVTNLELLTLHESTFDRLPDNIASMLLTCLCRDFGGPKRHYNDLQVSNAVVFGELAQCKLERVRIQRLVAEEATLARVEFHECEVISLFVDETTRFGATFPKAHRVHLKDANGVVRDIFDPAEIEAWIVEHSDAKKAVEQINRDAIRLLDRVCRIMIRQHVIKDHEDDESGRVLKDPLWPSVEKILSDAGLIDRIHNKQMSGARAPFIRMRNPYGLLAQRTSPESAPIWSKVGAIS